MAGLYLHIPFCKQACFYCDFHFSVNLSYREEIINAMVNEIFIQKDYLGASTLDTIYFGGGTPSLLKPREIENLFNAIYKNFKVNKIAEITLEANPEDINEESINAFKSLGINRISIGTQSFNDDFLRWMNRSHTGKQALDSIILANKVIKNVSIDLIYGIPSDTHLFWQKDLDIAMEAPINHISTYNLTIEDKTVFGNALKKGSLKPINDDFSAKQFEMVMDTTNNHRFVHYEISNFAKEGYISQHNSNYWRGIEYLGIGPSSHSFNLKERQFNISHNIKYIKSLNEQVIPFKKETLTEINIVNEYLLTGLRTIWGINLEEVYNHTTLKFENFNICLNRYLDLSFLDLDSDNIITLTRKGKFFADKIISDLFFE